MRPNSRYLFLLLFLFILLPCTTLHANKSDADNEFLFNFHETDIRSVIESVAKITQTNFVVAPNVQGKITVISSTPISGEEVYDVFLSILYAHGYAVIDEGGTKTIIPAAVAPNSNISVLSGDSPLPSQNDFITRIQRFYSIQAESLIPIIKPLMDSKSRIAVHKSSNSLLITDRAKNIERLLQIVVSLDVEQVISLDIIQLKFATAANVARILTNLNSHSAQEQKSLQELRLIADERSNSIILAGQPSFMRQAKEVIQQLDKPLEFGDTTQVHFLRHAIAKDLVPILTGMNSSERKQAGKKNHQNPLIDASILIQADEATNALIITAPSSEMKKIVKVIDALDIRRKQVMIEAVIAEVSNVNASEIGVQWRSTTDADSSGVIGGTNFNSQQSASGNINAVSANPLLSLTPGFAIGYFEGTSTILGTEILNITSLLNALSSSANTNILSTPTLVTLDNQEAQIVVGQNVPFATGSYTSASNGNPDNPFTTYERKDVGIKLKIKPQINEGDTIRLEINQEVSSIIPSASTAGLQSTNTRMISTTIVVENKKTIVLGGLISDDIQESIFKVPLLGDIPLLGSLFRYSSSSHDKKNLMVFIRPVIMYDQKVENAVTINKYNQMKNEQEAFREKGVSLMPDLESPVLPELQIETIIVPAHGD